MPGTATIDYEAHASHAGRQSAVVFAGMTFAMRREQCMRVCDERLRAWFPSAVVVASFVRFESENTSIAEQTSGSENGSCSRLTEGTEVSHLQNHSRCEPDARWIRRFRESQCESAELEVRDYAREDEHVCCGEPPQLHDVEQE
eukprot:4044699-Pleurochrysis_carterae.AAC.2